MSQTNSEAIGVQDNIEFKQQSIKDLILPPLEKPGTLVVNPPYGERLGDVQRLKKTYNELGTLFKTHFKGWDCYVLSGNPELSKEIRLKSERHMELMNGPITCRFLHYPIR